jgi:hypothetical protein
MDHLPFNTVGLSLDGVDKFYTALTSLKDKFTIQATGHIDFHLEQFEVFKHYSYLNLRGSFVIKQCDNDCYIFFIEVHFKHRDKGHLHITEHIEHQIWALAYLKHDFGRILIRPETLADKIIEIIHPVEVDFKEDKAFSDTFYVLVNDHEKAVAGIDRNFRNAVMDIRADDFVIEIVEHTLIIGSTKPISADKAIHLTAFIERVAATC